MKWTMGIVVLTGAVLSALPCVSRAQTAAAPLPVPSSTTTAPSSTATPPTNGTRPLSSVAAEIGRAARAIILTDSTVASQYVAPPAVATTRANFESQLDNLVKTLPTGSTWAKVYLPETGSASHLNPDAVTNYLMAQARLFGTAGAASPPGMVEILGQRIAEDKAAPIIAALNLKPIYIIADPNRRSSGAPSATRSPRSNRSSSSANQRRQYDQSYSNRGVWGNGVTGFRYNGRALRRSVKVHRYGF